MDNSIKDSDHAPGAQVPKKEVPTVEQIKLWIERDLQTSVTFLQALQNDAELRQQMAVFLQGRLSNYVNKQDPRQAAIDFGIVKATA